MHIRHTAALLCCILCTAFLGGCAKNSTEKEPETESSASEPTDADTVAAFEATTIDGTSLSSSVFSDSRITMVNVWATYCNPCLREMPELRELAGEYDTEDFQLIGIISDVPEDSGESTLQTAADLIEETKADYPHLLLNESLYNALLTGVSAVPTTFFIDQEGKVLDTVIGAMEKSAWKEKIDGLLEE